MSVSKEKVLEQLDRARLIELTRQVADIVSITGEEKGIAEFLGGEFGRLGMEVKYQEVEGGRPNVIGTLRGSGGGATLMFNGHMDHFDNPHPTEVIGDRIYGRGLVNMKCAFPCYIMAAQMLKQAKVRPEMLYTSSGWSIYEGWEFTGWPVMTIVRGNIVAQWSEKTNRMEMVGEPVGRYVSRRLGSQYLYE